MLLQAPPPALLEAFERAQERENLTVGRRANEKGRLAEWRCLQAALVACAASHWLHNARLATQREDARGIDIVVATNLGNIYLQVKSSHHGAKKFRRKRPKSKAIVIIVHPDMTDGKLQNKVSGALHYMQRQIKLWRTR